MEDSVTNIINTFYTKKILVLGDFMLDVYLKGISTRLCPEAPVPVVDIMEKTALLGGSANTACNLKALGGCVDYCTVMGTDHDGDEAMRLLNEMGIHSDNVIKCPDRKTITKSRIVAGTQVITRFDQGCEGAINREIAEAVIRILEKSYRACDAVIISDYNKGVITEAVVDKLVTLQKQHPKFIAVDSKRLPFFSRLQPSLAKPNYDESIRLLDLQHQFTDRTEQIKAHALQLFQKVNARVIAVTLDKEGSIIIENGEVIYGSSTPSMSNPHVAGAGDTYLSGFVLTYLSNENLAMSADLATSAAAIAIQKECTSTCSQTELKNYYNMQSKCIISHDDLKDLCDGYRAQGKRIVFTNGCFDILHSGHVTYLHCAKELGDVLIVGMNTDESIKRIKGDGRPINPMADRLQVLAGLTSVDHIIPFGHEFDDTPISLIRVVRPHVFAKGGDYTRDRLPEGATVEACGGEIVFLEHIPDHSTTQIINRITYAKRRHHPAVTNLQS